MISGIGMKSVSTNEDTEKVLTDQSEALKMILGHTYPRSLNDHPLYRKHQTLDFMIL